MIDLDSEKWSVLKHAYGAADDIPGLLLQLADYPLSEKAESEPYFSLWSRLCHQGDVYDASYAVLPHILSLAKTSPTRITRDYLLLPVCIEIARSKGNGPDMPAELNKDYFSAFQVVPTIIGHFDTSRLDETWSLTLAAALAIAGNLPDQAEAILELEGTAAHEVLKWLERR